MKENIVVSVKDANEICKDALIAYGKEQGLEDVTVELCIERLVHKRKLLNCKRRGIVIEGTRDVTDESRETEGDSPSVSGDIPEPERKASPKGPKKTSKAKRNRSATGQFGKN